MPPGGTCSISSDRERPLTGWRQPGATSRKGTSTKARHLHARMRQSWRALFDPSVIIEEIEVERPGRVGQGALAPELSLHLVQHAEERRRGKICPNDGHGVDKSRIARIGPSRASVETGLLLNRYASSREFAKRRIERCRRRTRQGWKIGSKRYQDHGLPFPNSHLGLNRTY